MAKRNKIFLGLFFILLGLFLAVAAFYQLEVKPTMAERKQEDARLGEIAKVKKPAAPPNKILLDSLVEESKSLYGEPEEARKEGILWTDVRSSRFIVTLGALQGLLPGKHLAVYDGNNKMGEVTVEKVFDIISYVQPMETPLNFSPSNYYRVVLE